MVASVNQELDHGYSAEFVWFEDVLSVEISSEDKKAIGSFRLYSVRPGKDMYSRISLIARESIDRIIEQDERKSNGQEIDFYVPEFNHKVFSLYEEYLRKAGFPSDSDEDFDDSATEIPKLSPNTPLSVSSMTIRCKDGNIKGSELIQIVHAKVCERKQSTAGDHPEIEENVLYLKSSSDWFQTLGGWKNQMPMFEQEEWAEKLQSVRMYECPGIFKISEGDGGNYYRFDLPEGFDFAPFVSAGARKGENPHNNVRHDLSYDRIANFVKSINENYNINDSRLAAFQLGLLRGKRLGDVEPALNDYLELEQFLNFLNALMFGIESSGLNASLVTSLMTLDLIADGKCTYSGAFDTTNDRGIYPYSCVAKEGIFNRREIVLMDQEFDGPALSMQNFRKNPPFSPVAAKEAVLIKYWLKHRGVLDQTLSCEDQIAKVKEAIDELIEHYFFPDQVDPNHEFVVEKFRPVKKEETK